MTSTTQSNDHSPASAGFSFGTYLQPALARCRYFPQVSAGICKPRSPQQRAGVFFSSPNRNHAQPSALALRYRTNNGAINMSERRFKTPLRPWRRWLVGFWILSTLAVTTGWWAGLALGAIWLVQRAI